MTELTATQLSKYALKMLQDYDSNTPGTIFKDNFRISIVDAWHIQSAITKRKNFLVIDIDNHYHYHY